MSEYASQKLLEPNSKWQVMIAEDKNWYQCSIKNVEISNGIITIHFDKTAVRTYDTQDKFKLVAEGDQKSSAQCDDIETWELRCGVWYLSPNMFLVKEGSPSWLSWLE
jgi:hypothetical protein